jgi:adenine-specific DNA-methyltransferase
MPIEKTAIFTEERETASGLPQLSLPGVEETATAPEYVEIFSRRYLGSKSRLLPFLHRIAAERCGNYCSFADLFAGTGVVAHSFNKPGVQIVANDYLASNAVSLSCWLGITELSEREASGLIAYLNALPADEDNYVSDQYGDRYFSLANARKIGIIRDEIDRLNLDPSLRALALTSLLYAMDRVAHTVGHYDAYRQGTSNGKTERRSDSLRDRPIRLQVPRVEYGNNRGNEVYQADANELARQIEVDVLYLDPPYNSRQYSDTYHVLENVILNDKPDLIGVARKRPGRPSRSRYCGKDAAAALEDLVMNAKCRWILFSYNNMADGDKRSNSILSDEEIVAILGLRGTVDIYKTAFNSFTAKRELIVGHEERVYVCEMAKFNVQSSRFKVSTNPTLNLEPATLNRAEPEAKP